MTRYPKIEIVAGERVTFEKSSNGQHIIGTLTDQTWVWEVGKSEAEVTRKLTDDINGYTPGSGYVPRTEEE